MDTRMRIVVAISVAAAAAGLAVLLFVEDANPPGDSRLERLTAQFEECLPEGTTDAQREEIRGIMTRFHDRAMAGRVHPQDVAEIESDLTAYIDRGEILKSELFEFMSKVGSATRGLGSNPQRGED